MIRPRTDRTAVLPAVLAVLVALALALDQGGFSTADWYTAGLFLTALLGVVMAVSPRRVAPRPPLVTAAIAALGAGAAFSVLSILWAEDRGAAWQGGNRALVYALAFAVLARQPWPRRAARATLTGIVVVLGVAGVVILALTAAADEPSRLFLEGRLAAPIDYANASASLWLIALFPALWLGTEARAWPWRAAGLGLACLFLQLATLSQSRGAALALVVAAVLYLAWTPRRLPALLGLAVLAALLALDFGSLTAVREAADPATLDAALAQARRAIAVSCLAAAAAGGLAGLAGPRLPATVRGPRARRAGDAVVMATGLVLVVAALVAIGSPGAWIDARWTDFKTTGYAAVESGDTRFGGSLGSNRYDFWRVALADLRAHPLGGVGADNFADSYLRERRSDESPRYPHSLPIGTLGQTGLVGGLLLLGFLACATAAALRARRRGALRERAVIAAAVGGFGAWLAQASADWLWELPGLTLLALALLAIAVGFGDPPPEAAGPPPRSRLGVGLGVVALLAVAASLAGPALAARYIEAAYADYQRRPAQTLARLDRAARLNPLSAEPLLARGILARRSGAPAVALESLRRAEQRLPRDWFVAFELALQEAVAGRRAVAVGLVDRARALNPRQAVLRDLRTALRGDAPIDPAVYERALNRQRTGRLTPFGAGR